MMMMMIIIIIIISTTSNIVVRTVLHCGTFSTTACQFILTLILSLSLSLSLSIYIYIYIYMERVSCGFHSAVLEGSVLVRYAASLIIPFLAFRWNMVPSSSRIYRSRPSRPLKTNNSNLIFKLYLLSYILTSASSLQIRSRSTDWLI